MPITDENDLQSKCGELVAREVIYCVSGLVYDLTAADGAPEAGTDEAIELWTADSDYIEAAEQNGVTLVERDGQFYWHETGEPLDDDADAFDTKEEAAADACDMQRIDVDDYRPEIYEHWLVTDWLARKLGERGEKVVSDWHGLTIWCRCTSGQAIAIDEVIREIVRELHT